MICKFIFSWILNQMIWNFYISRFHLFERGQRNQFPFFCQTYKEHLEGQKHKKKAASATTDLQKFPRGTYKCELCDVVCTGKDAFVSHVMGNNHTKVIYLPYFFILWQTYKTHLEGAKHKKKAASTTSDTTKLPPGTYKCELCDVICTGKDTFIAHVKGSNHTKVNMLL